MEKVVFEDVEYANKVVGKTPEYINTTGVELGKCTNNAKLIVDINPSYVIAYVEGFIVTFEDNEYRSQPHAWNSLKGYHFDSTGDLFNETYPKFSNVPRFYFPFQEVNIDSLPKFVRGIQPFTDRFKPFILYMNKKYPAGN